MSLEAEILRRIENLIRVGTIAEVSGTFARVRYDVDANNNPVLTAMCPCITPRAGADSTWWQPSIGEQVIMFSPSGDLALAFILPAINQDAHPAPSNLPAEHKIKYADGTEITYNKATQVLDATLAAGGTTNITADGGINLIGPVNITGSLDVSEDITTAANVNAQAVAAATSLTVLMLEVLGHVHAENNLPGSTGPMIPAA